MFTKKIVDGHTFYLMNYEPFNQKPREQPTCQVCGEAGELCPCDRCGQEYCSNCQAPYNQHSQIDWNCCMNCYEDLKWRNDGR